MRKLLAVAGLAVSLFGVWVYFVYRWNLSVQPGGQTLAEVLSKLPVPAGQKVFVQDGREYLAVFGPNEPFPAFTSGPPLYIFDRTGRLVDWTQDFGDSEAFNERWHGWPGGRTITHAELLQWPDGAR